MLRWLFRLLIIGLIGLGVAYAVSRLMGQDEDFDDFDDDFDEMEGRLNFEETPVEIEVPAQSATSQESKAAEMSAGVGGGAGGMNQFTSSDTGGKNGGSSGAPGGGGSLIDINGIGPNYAARLEAAGITSLQDLANANAEDVASKIDVIGGASSIEDWIAQAKSMTS